MNNRSFSEEEMRQREKEERSRLRKQEQAYREAQRGVYSRIYQEQDAMPEDYRAAFWEDPRDRLYDQRPGRGFCRSRSRKRRCLPRCCGCSGIHGDRRGDGL